MSTISWTRRIAATCRLHVARLTLAGILALSAATGASAGPEIWRNFGWKATDFSKSSVPFKEIRMGVRVPPGMSTKDRIPAIDQPKFEPAGSVEGLQPMTPVITLDLNGDARAYPLAVLTWHEIVNDTVGGIPVAVTYCPLCNTALVFDRRVDGTVYDFGTSGLLRHSDLVMYDRQTDSWWQQFTGEAIVGAMTGAVLKGVPARLEAFSLFTERYPDGQVLVPSNPGMRPYGRNPYVGYDTSPKPFLYGGPMPVGIDPMARVVMVEAEGREQAVALALLRKKGTMTLGDVEIAWTPGQNSALDASRIADGQDVGNVIARRKAGDAFEDIVYHVTFAFAYHAFYPDGVLHTD